MVTALVRADDFESESNRAIWESLTVMNAQDVPIDPTTICSRLKGKGVKQDYVEGLTFFKQTDPELVNQYALDVKTGASGRRLVELGNYIGEGIYSGKEPEEILQITQKHLDKLSETGVKRSSSFHEGFLNLVKILDDPSLAKESKRIPTKWRSVDRYLDGGLQLGQLDVIAGRTGMGKTSFATTLLTNIASQKIPSLMISIEMPEPQIIRKMISGYLRIPESKLAQQNLEQSDWDEIVLKHKELSSLPVHIDDTSRTLYECLNSIRSHVRRYGVQFVVIDYVQRVKVPQRDARYLEVGEICDDLAELAKRMQINIMVLSQINRGVENRTSKRPVMSDLSESGKIEEAASRIFLLYRDEAYEHDSNSKGIAEVNLAKNRFGGTGVASMAFVKEFTMFADLA
tara:strand:+ start:1743 stop:2945 length:1203 start_codon:yes stop_codon:yes gene_type:complete